MHVQGDAGAIPGGEEAACAELLYAQRDSRELNGMAVSYWYGREQKTDDDPLH